jgi:hypothetical protein
MGTLEAVLHRIKSDVRYAEGIAYGRPRVGHAEGSVKNHLADLDANLERLRPLVSEEEYWKLAVLIHVHDTFKYCAKRDSAIRDPRSHASLARGFLAEFGADDDLLRMVQFHDEGFALFKQFEESGKYSQRRMTENVLTIRDMDLYLLFTIIDGHTASKDDGRVRWFIDEVNKHRATPRAYQALNVLGITAG